MNPKYNRHIKPLSIIFVLTVILFSLVFFFKSRLNRDLQSDLEYTKIQEAKSKQSQSPHEPNIKNVQSAQEAQNSSSGAAPTGIQHISESDPAVTRARIVNCRRLVIAIHQRAINALGISDSATRQKIIDIIVSRQMTIKEAGSLLSSKGIASSAGTQQIILDATQPEYNELVSLLGATKANELLSNIALSGEITSIERTLGADMEYKGVPMSNEQVLRLAAALKKNNYVPYPIPAKAISMALGAKYAHSASGVIEDAKSFLTEDQLNAIRESDAEKGALAKLLYPNN